VKNVPPKNGFRDRPSSRRRAVDQQTFDQPSIRAAVASAFEIPARLHQLALVQFVPNGRFETVPASVPVKGDTYALRMNSDSTFKQPVSDAVFQTAAWD
jgi:hypothetical protein